jgi:phosphoserine phosphatase RsbU/P
MGADERALEALTKISKKLEIAIRAARSAPRTPAIEEEEDDGYGDLSSGPPEWISKLTTALATVHNHEELYESCLKLCIEVSKSQRGLILVVEGTRVRFKTGRGADSNFLPNPRNRLAMDTINVALQGQNSQFMPNGKSPEGQLRSMIATPFMVKDESGAAKLSGLLYIEDQRKEISEDDFNSVKAIVDIVSLAINRLSLSAVTQKSTQQVDHYKGNLDQLLEVSRVISSTLDINDLLALIVDKSLEVTRASRGYVMLTEGDKLEFKVGRWWNRLYDEDKRTRSLTEDQFFFSQSVTGKALKDKKPVCLTDVMSGDDDNPSMSLVQMEIQSVMCAPLLDGETVIGLVYVDSQAKAKEFVQSDLDLFEGLAGQAAIALKNAFLYNQVGEKERMKGELEIAARMQNDLLPKEIPEIRNLQLAGFMEPAKEVGGDYFDFVEEAERPGDALNIVVGDVSGKGLGAGILAVMARCTLRTMLDAYGGESPKTILTYLNSKLAADAKPGQFMTMILMYWDSELRTLTYSSAGHEQILHWHHSTGETTATVSGGSPLALSASMESTENTVIQCQPGDMIVLYTDGVTEAMDENSEEFELERLLPLVNTHGGGTAQNMLDVINAAVINYRGKMEQSDDISLVALKVTS